MLEVAERAGGVNRGRGRWRCSEDRALPLCGAASCFLDPGRTHTGLGDVPPFTRLVGYLARLSMSWFCQSPFLLFLQAGRIPGDISPSFLARELFILFFYSLFIWGCAGPLLLGGLFSSCRQRERLCLRCLASRCGGFPGGGARAAGCRRSAVAAPALCSTGWVVVGPGFAAPRQAESSQAGIELVSPALVGTLSLSLQGSPDQGLTGIL